jgi:hypothetical protein
MAVFLQNELRIVMGVERVHQNQRYITSLLFIQVLREVKGEDVGKTKADFYTSVIASY